MEFYYSKGVALIQVLEGEHISVEVFPDNQSTESFEKGSLTISLKSKLGRTCLSQIMNSTCQ